MKCVFLWYAPDAKAYKLYDMTNRKIFLSRDVIFHEHIFPYETEHPKPDYHDTPLPIPSDDTVNTPEKQPQRREETLLPTNTPQESEVRKSIKVRNRSA